MRTRSSVLFFLLTLVFAGCDRSTGPDESGYLEIQEVTVGPTLAKCYGVGLQSCMVVDGGLFYDGIEGFEYEAGYDYRLRIGKYDPWGGQEPPQDAGRYAYRLLKQLEKTPAPSTPATLSVGPTRVICARSDDFCLVVDGAPYDDMITNFEYEAGYHYVLEANRYDDGRYVLSEVVSSTKAAGTEEEITVDAHRAECDDRRVIRDSAGLLRTFSVNCSVFSELHRTISMPLFFLYIGQSMISRIRRETMIQLSSS